MSEMIKNGVGDGSRMKVDKNNRAHIQATTVTDSDNANTKGNAYNINTGVLTLSDAAKTPVLYFKNLEDNDVHVKAIAIGFGPSTGATGGIPVITVEKNPTGGTIVSAPTDVAINSNRNYGSTNTLDSNAYVGATDDTMTGGTDHLVIFQTQSGRLFATIDEIIPKGKSLGITVTPKVGNTAMVCYAALICHLQDPENKD